MNHPTSNIALDLVLGLPPTIKAQSSGAVPFLGEVLSAKNVAPTLLVNDQFGDAGSVLRPYLGVGVNYTRFADAKSTDGWQLSLSDRWGLAAQAWVGYAINRQWGLFASVGAAQVKSNLVAIGAAVLRTTIDFRPITLAAGESFKF